MIYCRSDARRVVVTKSRSSVQKLGQQKKDWSLTPNAFHRLLEWLDEGEDSGGQKYLEMRRRLVAYFDRKNCLTPDDLADETLNRVSRRLVEEGAIESESPAKYCYIVARFVFMEYLRGAQKESVPLDDVLHRSNEKDFAAPAPSEERAVKEAMLDCLEHCTAKLEPTSRDIIIRYYFGEERVKIENRRALAASLNITMNALSIRACRIRDKLEACVGKCVG
jgi:DNA-directed RNA polymerase specialized sigma24 family protein